MTARAGQETEAAFLKKAPVLDLPSQVVMPFNVAVISF